MAVTTLPVRTSMRIALANGTDPETGKSITLYTTIGELAPNPDGQKLMDIVDAASLCLVGSVANVQTTEVKTLEKV